MHDQLSRQVEEQLHLVRGSMRPRQDHHFPTLSPPLSQHGLHTATCHLGGAVMSRNDRLFEKCAAISQTSGTHSAAHDPARSARLPPPCHSADLRRHLVAGGRRLLGNLEGPRNLRESGDQGIRSNNDLSLFLEMCSDMINTFGTHFQTHTIANILIPLFNSNRSQRLFLEM